jgi:GrpB-like predicted nucleotidyltransferase (UPF0157 family)
MALTSNLETYNTEWPSLFTKEAELLKPLFGVDLIDIHHVGSTAIPGMLAKPEIDILVILKDNADFASYFKKIETVGYTFRGEEPGVQGHWYFSKNQNQRRTHKLHLCGPTHPCVSDQLTFRNFLRKNTDRAQEYATLKKKLAESNASGMSEYLEKKAPFIQEILRLAKR